MQETWVQSLGWEDLLNKEMQPTPVLLPGEFHGQRSRVGYSPWSPKESDTAEGLSTTTTHFTDGICFSSHDISVGQLELYPVFEKKKLRPREMVAHKGDHNKL